MKTLNLKPEDFQKPATMPAVLKPIPGIPGLHGTFPSASPGHIILTDNEKKKLLEFGWNEGDPLPGNISQLISVVDQEQMAKDAKRFRQIVEQDMKTAKPPMNHPVLKPPKEIDISQLGTSRQKELAAHLAEFKQMAPQIEEAIKAKGGPSQLTPAVQKALEAAGEGIRVYDSRNQVLASAQDFQQKIDEVENHVAKELDSGLEPEKKLEDLSEKRLHISDNDKALYLASIWGAPFEKEYSYFGGRVKFVFHQLATKISRQILKELAWRVRQDQLSENEQYQEGITYRAVLSLKSFTVNGEDFEIDTNIQTDEIDNDGISIIVKELLNDNCFKNESVWRAFRDCYIEFNAMIEYFESKRDDPNFWPTIEG